jgi:hypothetical protein
VDRRPTKTDARVAAAGAPAKAGPLTTVEQPAPAAASGAGRWRLRIPYRGVRAVFGKYWVFFGGLGELASSFYLHLAIVLTALMPGLWRVTKWWDLVLGVLPNLLGFTLGGYAILLAFGDTQFRATLAARKPGKKLSAWESTNGMFAHFVVVQVAALLTAVAARSCSDAPSSTWVRIALDWLHGSSAFGEWLTKAGWFLGCLLFIYSLVLAIAAVMGIFRLGAWQQLQIDRSAPLELQGPVSVDGKQRFGAIDPDERWNVYAKKVRVGTPGVTEPFYDLLGSATREGAEVRDKDGVELEGESAEHVRRVVAAFATKIGANKPPSA